MRDLVGKRVRGLYQDSLYRNSLFLLLNLGLNTVAGFLFVIICNRLYGKEAFGYASALLALMGLGVSISNLGMNRTGLRFLGAEQNRSALFATMAAIATGAGLLVGLGFVPFLDWFDIPGAGLALTALIVLSIVAGSARGICDNAFIAIRASSGTFASNAVFNVMRVGLPFAFVALGSTGVFAAVVVSVVAAVLVGLGLLSRAGFDFRVRPNPALMKGRWRFAIGTHSYELIGNATTSILPLVVLSRLGPAANSEWFVVMQIVTLLLMICSAVNNAMFAELASDTSTTRALVLRTLGAIYALLIPLVCAVLLFAPQVLSIFGADYVQAAPVLRLMAIFALFGVFNYIAGSYLSLHKRVLFITLVNLVHAAVVIAYGLFFAANLLDMAFGWMIGEVINLALFGIGVLWVRRSATKSREDAETARGTALRGSHEH